VVYDPSTSEFLEGLAAGQTATDAVPYTLVDGSFVFANRDLFRVLANGSNVVLEVLANDRDYTGVEGGLRITAVGATSAGGRCLIGPGYTNLVYTPVAGYVGDEVLTYKVTNGRGYSAMAQIMIKVTVDRLNGWLQATRDNFSVARGEYAFLSVLANDNVLPEMGTNLTVVAIPSSPNFGGQAVVSNNTICYTPNNAYVGSYPYTEQLKYAISGGGAALATALVEVLVVNRQGELVVGDDVFSVDAGSFGTSLDILYNDDILPGLPVTLTVSSVGPVPHGSVTIDGDRRGISYIPNEGFIGVDTFTYVATDRVGGTGTGLVTVTVGSLVACSDTFVVTNLSPAVDLNVLRNDYYLQETFGDNIIIQSVTPTNTAMGSLSVAGDGSHLVFGPALQSGEQVCSYTITDGGGRTASANVKLVVVTNGIHANADEYAVFMGSANNILNVLSNDASIPVQGKTLTILSVGIGLEGPNHGGVVIVASNKLSLTYTPADDFSGEETFYYTLSDSITTSKAKVVVKVSRGILTANPDYFTVYMPGTGEAPLEFVLPVIYNDCMVPDFCEPISIVALGNGTNAPDQMGEVSIGEDGMSIVYAPLYTNGIPDYVERFTYDQRWD
jgi:hypothetical protein